MKIDELRTTVWNTLIEPTPRRLEKFLIRVSDKKLIQTPPPTFSVFLEEGARAAAEVYNEFFRIADSSAAGSNGEDARESALSAVMVRYKELEQRIDPE